MSEKLYKYNLEIRRSSDLEGYFILTDKEYESLKGLTGANIYYGEVAGKHSEVTAVFDLKDVELVTSDRTEVLFFKKLFGTGSGFGFAGYWFDRHLEQAGEAGYAAVKHKKCKTVEEGLEWYPQYDNDFSRKEFIQTFNETMNGI